MVEEKLGEGGMGCVYRARHTVLDREYAIKVLFADFATDERFLARFRREAQSMSRVRHPNIVTVEDFGASPDGQTFLAMELVRGRNLESVIARDAPLPAVRAARLFRQMVEGLSAAHQGGFVHRDVKPANLMITLEGTEERIKILDFGAVNLQHSLPANERLTHVGHIIGTPTYMAPEQSQDPNVGPTADLYALGVVLYEMLSGDPPFVGDGRAEVLVKHITVPAPELPPAAGLERLVAWLLRKLPADRPQSAEQVLAFLDSLGLEAGEDEATAVTPLELDDLGQGLPPPTPPTLGGSGARPPAQDLRQLYDDLRDRPASEPVSDVLAQDTFPSLDSHAEWSDWAPQSAEYASLDADTDDDTRPAPVLTPVAPERAASPTDGPAPFIAEDLVIESAIPFEAPTGPAAVATQVVRERVTPTARAEITDPIEMFGDAPAPLAPTHESDDGGPTQVDFDIESNFELPAAIPVEPPAPKPPLRAPSAALQERPASSARPMIQTEVSDLSPDTSATVLEGDEVSPQGTVPLPLRPSELPGAVPPYHAEQTPTPTDSGPSFGIPDTVLPGPDADEIPTFESPPPPAAAAPTVLTGASAQPHTPSTTPAVRAKRSSPLKYYVAIVGLLLLIVVLGWILLSGQRPIDLGTSQQREMPTAES